MSDVRTKLKVLILAEDFYPKKSGGAFVDWNVARALSERGHQVIVVTLRTEGLAEYEVVDGVEIHRPYEAYSDSADPNALRSQLLRLKFLGSTFPYVHQLQKRKSFNVIYSTNHLLHPISKTIRTIHSVPVVNFVGYSPTIEPDIKSLSVTYILEQFIFRFALGDKILCRTPDVRNAIQSYNDVECKTVDGILNPDEIRDVIRESEHQITLENSTITLLFVGRFTELKNPVQAVKILQQLPAQFELVMIGDGPLFPKVETAINQYDEEDRINLLGICSHEETLRYIGAADLLILPSKTEAYPTVVFEALSLKTPVVATPVGILPETNHQRLMLSDVEEFPAAIQSIDIHSERSVDNETLDRFSINKFVNEVIEALHSAIQES